MIMRDVGLKSLSLATLCLLAACEGSPISGGACVTNLNCPADEQCVGGVCVPAQVAGCKNDDACSIGEYCDTADGVCKTIEIVGCTTDEICPPDQRCNTLTGVCVQGRRSCTDEAQCTAIGKHCDTTVGQCVDCLTMSHCPSPNICFKGSCVDPSQGMCMTDVQCNPPVSVCNNGICAPGCDVPGAPTCPLGTFCNTGTGHCDAGQVTCMNDSECSPPASICESGQCIPGCTQIGGLQCTGGFVCNASSGRCEPASGCTNDAQCGAPAQICESGQCVPGCGQPGAPACVAGTVCDTGTGRCVTVQGPCMNDTECGAPTGVCETGQCVPGCGQVGGIQCTGNTVCNTTSGRCDPGGPVCMGDQDCAPPTTICNLGNGACDPGCSTTGCVSPEVCNAATGHCYDPGMQGGTQPLNAACTAASECQSSVCFDFGGSIGRRCVASCGTSGDCPASFTCYDYFGARMCISNQLVANATFTDPAGATCADHTECKSYYCDNVCIESCAENSDCGGGQCKWDEYSPDFYISACNGPLGAGGNGASCTANNQCRSGVCYGSGTCGDLCGSTADCPNGNICGFVNFSVCQVSVFGGCLQWAVNFVKACIATTHGTGPIGTPCTDAGPCRDGLCHIALSRCTGVCSRNADCPSSDVCGVEQYGDLDGTNIYVNVCVPR
jgi:hypothetical protein